MAVKETSETKRTGHLADDNESVDSKVATEESDSEISFSEHDEVTHAAVETEIDWKVQAAYLGAEVENLQKRFMREASEIRKYSNEDLLKKILPVLDTLSLALNATEKAKSQTENAELFENKLFKSFIQGVEMTARQFEQVLTSCGVEFIEASGKVFDPSFHEALGQAHDEGLEDNVITEEFQKGFKLAGRVIRPAKVIVNKKLRGNN